MNTINIINVIKSLKEGNMTKYDLEELSSMLDILQADLELELAEIEKSEALFLVECKEKTRSGATMKWDASEKGQSEIELKRKLKALSKLSSSVKTRIYQKY